MASGEQVSQEIENERTGPEYHLLELISKSGSPEHFRSSIPEASTAESS
jgi:hypothetical protein